MPRERAGAGARRRDLPHARARDHVGDTVALAQKFDCPVYAQVELRGWLSTQGLSENMAEAYNKGGTIEWEGIKATLTDANHSSSGFADGVFLYLGESCGIVFELEDGTTIYFAGDTSVFGDMQLIARIYEPDVAVLPIGDHFTMGPREAAVALELLGVKRCVASHYGTFPLLTGTPEQLRELAPGRRDPRAGARRVGRAVRERWFGATGRRVPELALEGSLDLDGALVLDDVQDDARLREAHAQGTPVVVRASTPEAVKEALARPEVATRPRPHRRAARPRPHEPHL